MIWWMSEIRVVKEGMGNETRMYNQENGNLWKTKSRRRRKLRRGN